MMDKTIYQKEESKNYAGYAIGSHKCKINPTQIIGLNQPVLVNQHAAVNYYTHIVRYTHVSEKGRQNHKYG
jgi:hypothetical protein